MTLEELLDMDADSLDTWDLAKMKAFFEPYLNFTRPERPEAKYVEHKSGSGTPKVYTRSGNELVKKINNLSPEKLAFLQATAKESGIDFKKLLSGKK